MYVIDNEGKRIEITNLTAAIEQADAYRQYRHSNHEFELRNKILAEYWDDLYEKLIQLRK